MNQTQISVVLVGGHWSPAHAVAEELEQHGVNIYFIGRRYSSSQGQTKSWEYSQCLRLGYRFLPLQSARFHRHSLWQTVRELPWLGLALYRSWRYLRQIKPAAVVCFGGYLSLPVGIMARLLGLRLIVHEQTAQAGLTNRWLARLADQVAISFPTSAEYFPSDKVVFTGNPVRGKLRSNPQQTTKRLGKRPTILFMGGNQGFAELNRVVLQAVPRWTDRYRLVHSFGRHPAQKSLFNQAQRLARQYASYEPWLFLETEQLAKILTQVNLVVSRAGANTCYELARWNQPAILIPLTYTGQTGEQQKNAQFLQLLGLVEILPEVELSVTRLERLMEQMLTNLDQYHLSRADQERYFPAQAAERLAKLILFDSR